jgi:thiol:disulfide interchange protein
MLTLPRVLHSFARRPLRAALFVAMAAALVACGKTQADEPSRDPASTASPTGAATTAPLSTTGWNTSQIAWQTYADGMRLAKEQHRPVCLVFSTTWCPHCKNYSHVFEDPRVVAEARDFVMIHLDSDVDEAVSSKYSLDGSYIPRTFFLSPDGTVDPSIHAPRPRSMYFYDERDPSQLLAAMDTAHHKLVN